MNKVYLVFSIKFRTIYLGCITNKNTEFGEVWMEHEFTECSSWLLDLYRKSKDYQVIELGDL